MRYLALATDYDGTLADHGQVSQRSIAALERVRASGRRLILVTGRELADLQRVFSGLDLFDRIIAENGAVLYRPTGRATRVLAERPPEQFLAALREKHVAPLSVGNVVVATLRSQDAAVLEVVEALGLELQIIFNRESLMILPSGVNKATGLAAALEEMELSPHNAVGVGDAENDHAFLGLSECGVAVANALPLLKERADFVTRAPAGEGVAELADRLLATDLAEIADRLHRHDLLLGHRDDGAEFRIPPYGVNLLITGPSGSGKSTLSVAFIERLVEHHYQFCLIDPEGDYAGVGAATSLGDGHHPPEPSEVLQVLAHPAQNVSVNLPGINLEDRPAYVESLLTRLQELRVRTGRPHWIVIGEAHHLLPTSWDRSARIGPRELTNLALITVHPDRVAQPVLARVNVTISPGPGEAVATGRWTDGKAIRFRYTLAG